MIERFKKLSQTEKTMIGLVILSLIMIALNWGRIYDGIKKGTKPYLKEWIK